MKKKVTFTKVSPNETKFIYKGIPFLLVEKDRGVYGIGKAIQLYQLKGMERTHIKEVGWTKRDYYGNGGMEKALITGLTNLEECKNAALKYIDQIL